MKRLIVLIIMVLSNTVIHSQGISDALRYSQDNLNGTARFSAMSGAFGALGGDLSSLNVNPAGSAVFSNNQMAVTLSNNSIKNNSNYFGTTSFDSNNFLDLNQAGGVFIFKTQDPKKDWKKIAFAINYDKTNNFDNAVFSEGKNQTNSVANYFLYYANADPEKNQPGIPLGTIQNYYYEELNFAEQQAFLGYEGYIINPVDTNSNNILYDSNIQSSGNYHQENSISTNGYNGKLSFNAATSYKDKLYLGINLNSHFTDYKKTSVFYESNKNSTGLRNLTFSNELYTYGSGFSMNLGTIVKVNKEIRVGLAWESPSWYTLNDELKQDLRTTGFNYSDPNDITKTIAGLSDANPDSNVTMIYAPYKLQTPSKTTLSFAYIFGKSGLISVDYAIKDYGNTQFKPKNEFSNTNTGMTNLLNQSGEFRFGCEYKIEAWSLRAGYRFEQSPYKNKNTMGDLTGNSVGIGYNFGSTKLDLSYTATQRDSNPRFFDQGYFDEEFKGFKGFTDGALINTTINTITATLLFEL